MTFCHDDVHFSEVVHHLVGETVHPIAVEYVDSVCVCLDDFVRGAVVAADQLQPALFSIWLKLISTSGFLGKEEEMIPSILKTCLVAVALCALASTTVVAS